MSTKHHFSTPPKELPVSKPTLNSIKFSELPAIGTAHGDGIFVGAITQPDGTHVAVLLLPDQAKDMTWQEATDWAAAQNAQLPTRPMAAMIFANTQDRLQSGWHWTCEEVKYYASSAWYCGFSYGRQDTNHKSYEGSAVAVRCIHITD
jgi:hypothetical protein